MVFGRPSSAIFARRAYGARSITRRSFPVHHAGVWRRSASIFVWNLSLPARRTSSTPANKPRVDRSHQPSSILTSHGREGAKQRAGNTVPTLIHPFRREGRPLPCARCQSAWPGDGRLRFPADHEGAVDSGYDRWVSVEVFDFSPGPEETARQSIACLVRCAQGSEVTCRLAVDAPSSLSVAAPRIHKAVIWCATCAVSSETRKRGWDERGNPENGAVRRFQRPRRVRPCRGEGEPGHL